MLLTPEIAALFPPLGEQQKPYQWSLFEVGPQPHGCLIAIGTIEVEGGKTRRLNVLAIDLTTRGAYSRLVMEGQGWWRGSDVQVTTGDVEIKHLRLRGQGIGTLVFNIVTAWAQRTFPDRDVRPITIVRPAGREEFERLNRFYGRFGFEWDNPGDKWDRHFSSRPMKVDALKQYPEELLANVRRVDLTRGITAMIERTNEAEDDRRMIAGLKEQLADRRERWRTIGYRLNLLGYGIATLAGFGAARALFLL